MRCFKLIEYKFVFDTGKVIFVRAESRDEAIKSYCSITGVKEDWIIEHCTITAGERLRDKAVGQRKPRSYQRGENT